MRHWTRHHTPIHPPLSFSVDQFLEVVIPSYNGSEGELLCSQRTGPGLVYNDVLEVSSLLPRQENHYDVLCDIRLGHYTFSIYNIPYYA